MATVSWRHILTGGFDYRRIQQNKPHYECPDVCAAHAHCPTADVDGAGRTRQLCWNEKHCQKSKQAKCVCSECCLLLRPQQAGGG